MPVEFGELPPDHRGGFGRDIPQVWVEEASALRAKPNIWARIGSKNTVSGAGNLARKIREGKLASFRPVGDFEAKTRGLDVWARYVGNGADAS